MGISYSDDRERDEEGKDINDGNLFVCDGVSCMSYKGIFFSLYSKLYIFYS